MLYVITISRLNSCIDIFCKHFVQNLFEFISTFVITFTFLTEIDTSSNHNVYLYIRSGGWEIGTFVQVRAPC